MIRRAAIDDIDWILGVAKACYPAFDEAASRAWGAANIDNPKVRIVRGEKGFAIGAINAPFYAPGVLRGYQVFLASEPRAGFEPCALVRSLITWAFKEQGVQSFHLGQATGQNLAPIAKRVGAMTDDESYVVMRSA